jgi:hypothetical protein
MLKTILKHKIIEIALDSICNNISNNFNANTNDLKTGMKLAKLTIKYDSIMYNLYNVYIGHVSKYAISLTYGATSYEFTANSEMTANQTFYAQIGFYCHIQNVTCHTSTRYEASTDSMSVAIVKTKNTNGNYIIKINTKYANPTEQILSQDDLLIVSYII